MADRYLLESGSPDGYLLEDGTGVLLLEAIAPVSLVVQDATVALVADNVVLVPNLIVQDAAIALTADGNLALYSPFTKSDNFNHALSGYDATSGTPAIVSSPFRSGSGALEISAAGEEYVAYNVPAGRRKVTQSVYIRFNTLPSADAGILSFIATTQGFLMYLTATQQFGVRLGGVNVAGGPTLSTGTWYLVDIEYDCTTTSGVVKAKVDSGTEFSRSATVTAADITAVRLGSTGATFTGYYEDWEISTATGAYPIGPHGAVTLEMADAAIALTADNIVLVPNLIVADSAIALAADNVVLTAHPPEGGALEVQDAAVALAADGVALTQHNALAVQDAAIALAADNLALVRKLHVLTVQGADIALAADAVVLTQHNALAVQDAALALVADNVTLSIPGNAPTFSDQGGAAYFSRS